MANDKNEGNPKEKYMVLYLSVKDGEVAKIYESDELGKIGPEVEALTADKNELRKKLPHLADVKKIKCYTIFHSHSSPMCLSFQVGTVWYQVCFG